MSAVQADSVQPPAGKRARLARLAHRAGVLPVLGTARALVRRDVRILAYHRVLDVRRERDFDFDLDLVSAGAEQFREQLKWLKRHYAPLRFDEWQQATARGRRPPRNAVLLTFDDGYDDNYRIAFPILREVGLSAMFFLATGHIDDGRPYAYDWLVYMLLNTGAESFEAPELGFDAPVPVPPRHDREGRRRLAATLLLKLKHADEAVERSFQHRLMAEWGMPRDTAHADCRPMNWDQVREMHAGGMEIGSHAVTHRMLRKLDDGELAGELEGSRRRLREELGADCTVISYPVGGTLAYDARVMAAARAAGYRVGCGYIGGARTLTPVDAFELGRLPIERDMDLAWFAATVALPELFSHGFAFAAMPGS